MARSRWPLPCFAAERRGFAFDFGEDMWDWERMAGSERSVDEEENVCESQPESRVGRSLIRAEDELEYIDTDGRISEIAPSGRSPRARVRGESDVSTVMITGASSALSPSPSVAVLLSPWPFPPPARPLRALAWLGDGDVCADEPELSVAAASGLGLSRPCFCRNLGSFEPCCGVGDAG